MSAKQAGVAAVVLADFVGSRSIEGFRRFRDQRLAAISERHLGSGRVAGEYAVTAWDEFQNLVPSVRDFPRVVWDLRCVFHPAQLSIAVGLGAVDSLPENGEPLNEAGSGPAFEISRHAMTVVKRSQESRSKYRLLTAVRGAYWARPFGDTAFNLTYRLLDSILLGITGRQWETILAYQETGSVEKAAERLGIDVSTVSRNLRRGSFWQIQDTLADLERALESAARESAALD